jgi:2-polyprenyl-6-methoxyphenol hydroxylase-like FAD-dependent oxidoreductase
MARRRQRALIIGGSIAGLYAARLLALRGWEVRVFERVAEDLRTRGAGIVTHPETFTVLRHAGLKVGAEIGIPVACRRAFARDATIILDQPWPQVMAHWAAIYALLRDNLADDVLQPGAVFTHIGERRNGVVAHFADGTSAEGDVLIGADGFLSEVRRQLHPGLSPRYAGNVAWRGVTPEGKLTQHTRERLFGEFCFCLPPREQMAGYPLRELGTPDGQVKRGYNFIWYRPVPPERLDRYLTDVRGQLHAVNVPPPLVRPDVVTDMRREAARLLNAEFVDIVEHGEPFYQPIFDLDVPFMARGRVALVGDAAFVARPHVGAGVTKALEDGLVLARNLDSDEIDGGLAAFDAERGAIGRRIVARGRELGAIMNGTSRREADRMREMTLGSATLDFLKQEQS